MVGEKYLEAGSYDSGRSSADNEHAFSGYNNDNYRTTYRPPLKDKLGYGATTIFGSVHPGVFNISRCDASVHGVSYDVDPLVWKAIGNRQTGASNLE
jgi:hypothetical protein